MTGSEGRRELALLAAGWPRTRGARFARGAEGPPAPVPDFATLAARPRWPLLDRAGQFRVAFLALLVEARDALAATVDGERLRSYAGVVGEEALEALLACGVPGPDLAFPPPDAALVATRAADLLDRAAEPGTAASRLQQAEHFLKERGLWRST